MRSWPEPVRFSVAPRTFVLADASSALPETAAPPVRDEAALEEAHRRGWEEGASHAEAQLLEQRQDFAACQDTIFQAIASQHRALVEQFAAALPLLAGQIAAKALAGCEPDAETLARIVAEALAELEPGTPEVEVALCPRDFALIEAVATEHGHTYPGLRLRADETLRAGDCRVLSRFGVLDARLRARLENTLRSLT